MNADAWLTLAVVVVTVGALATERIRPSVAVLGGSVTLLVIGVIDTEQAFAGFSNPAPISVAALYVVAGAVETTGAFGWLTARIMGSTTGASSGARADLARVLPAPLAASAFLNNTTVVAMLAPPLEAWARRTGRVASRVLMPLSFAAILGGVVTAIGTSTNLVVSGLLKQSGEAEMGLFEIGAVGLPLAVLGTAYLVFASPRLLPNRGARNPTAGAAREFTVEMEVSEGGPLVGRTVAEAGLRNLEGVFLVEIERAGHRFSPVAPDEVLVDGDRLTFAGDVGRILDLHRLHGLVPAEERHFSVADDGMGGREVYELVVAATSDLVGQTLRDVGFRGRYGAAVVAVHRAGEQLPGKLGQIELRPGDVLLVLSDAQLKERLGQHGDFLVVAPLAGQAPPRRSRARFVEAVLLALVIVVGGGWLDIVRGSLVAAFVLLGSKTISVHEARRLIDTDVLVLIAASFGLGNAIAASGLAEKVAGGIVGAFDSFGDVGLLAGVLLATIVLTELITNNAAAVMMFPIALAVAADAGLEPRGFAMAVAVGASASFLTPVGYQTNTMVYGMGGYRFGDFARLGAPLTLLVIVVSLVVIPIAWPLSG